ncbi:MULTISPECIES: hypothetical protein [Nocardiaceae]|jgi:hypothetical protein|uniref:hypothetical protein n=1 Tax=Nocardiaceae TaxID=85025 RepID=UPI00050C5F0D|nr:hypothetical protein [Rhodococcus fascians]MDJ0004884.1 hypothetical protein [Rhodococcus fascians]MDJ0468872.1 hypothetical protein [Rhodococcus fascians]
MTRNHVEKHAARAYAAANGVTYRQGLAAVRANCTIVLPYAQRLLIEAIEGCGIRHWSNVHDWDGCGRASITDLGGERFVLTPDVVVPVIREHLDAHPNLEPLHIDSYFADEAVQRTLFGGVIYRLELHRGGGLTV